MKCLTATLLALISLSASAGDIYLSSNQYVTLSQGDRVYCESNRSEPPRSPAPTHPKPKACRFIFNKTKVIAGMVGENYYFTNTFTELDKTVPENFSNAAAVLASRMQAGKCSRPEFGKICDVSWSQDGKSITVTINDNQKQVYPGNRFNYEELQAGVHQLRRLGICW